MSIRRSVSCLLVPLVLAGCATSEFGSRSSASSKAPKVVVADPDEVRAAQLRKQGREIEELREALAENRERADAAAARSNAAALQAQSAIQALQAELGEVRVRADAAGAQSDKAFEIATEFLSNLVAARQDQAAIVERNVSAFGGMEQRLAAIENRILETRQRGQAELAATRTQSTEMEQRLRDADRELAALREQLLQLNRQNEETRAALDSGPMLQMLRQLEGTQRDTSGLRGALEEMQHEQEDARRSMRNYYLDLDARIQSLQDRERAAREAGAALDDAENFSMPTPAVSDSGEDMPGIEPYDTPELRDTIESLPLPEGIAPSPSPSADVLPFPEGIAPASSADVLPFPEGIAPASSEDVETAAPVPGASSSTPEASQVDAEAGKPPQNESVLQTEPGQGDEAGTNLPVSKSPGDPADALPDIVDTVDIVPDVPIYLPGSDLDYPTDRGENSGDSGDAPLLRDNADPDEQLDDQDGRENDAMLPDSPALQTG